MGLDRFSRSFTLANKDKAKQYKYQYIQYLLCTRHGARHWVVIRNGFCP